MSLETQIVIGMAGTGVGTIIAFLACLLILKHRDARITHVPVVPKCVREIRGDFVSICGWCPDAKDGNAYAESIGLRQTHGICPACRAIHFPGIQFKSA